MRAVPVPLSEVMQTTERVSKAAPVGEGNGVANQCVDFLSDRATTQRVAHPATTDLQLHEQMEMAQLQYPVALCREFLHPGEVVHDEALHASLRAERKRGDDLLPSRGPLLAWQQLRIEENRVGAAA